MNLELIHEQMRIYARQHADIQELRMATINRIRARTEAGLGGADVLDAQAVMFDAMEHDLDLSLGRLVKQHPLYPWVQQAKGISPRTFALLFGITDDLYRFDTVANLWAYLGLHVVNGESPRRKKGQKSNWNTDGRTRAYLIAEAIVKIGSERARCGEYTTHLWAGQKPDEDKKVRCGRCSVIRGSREASVGELVSSSKYYDAYARKREEYFARPRLGESGCPMGQSHRDKLGNVLQCVKPGEVGETSAHLHAAAMRYAVKELLKDMWVEWRRVVPRLAEAA